MSDAKLIHYCAPTLAGIKAANLFNGDDSPDIDEVLSRWNAALNPKGVQVLCLAKKNGRPLIYVYRPAALAARLQNEECEAILRTFGYTGAGLSERLARLAGRLLESDDFPHEIGLFLDYPTDDVRGFIAHQGKACKCSGCWKVYGDEKGARCRFAGYKKCTRVYERCFKQGFALDRLTVGSSASHNA